MTRFLALLLLALAALPVAHARADNVTLITLDTTELELVERSASKTSVEFLIPARLGAAGVKLRRWSIAQDGRLIDRAGSGITLRTAADGTPELYAKFDLSKLNVSGRYQATLEFVAPKPPARPAEPPAPGTPAAAGQVTAGQPATGQATTGQPPTKPAAEAEELEQTVQLKLTRPAAELRVSMPMRIERTVYLPSWLVGYAGSLEPGSITLTEGAGKSWVRIDPDQWEVVLRHGDDAPEGHRLKVRLPTSIDGWGQAQAQLTLDGPVAIGTTSGTLTIRAPQLAAQTVDIVVTLVSHVSALWLWLVIIVGICVGWYFRNRLETERARLAAVVPAERELATLDDLINATADRTFRTRLEQVRSVLARTIEDKAGTPETIAAATTKAASDRDGVVKAMSDLRDKLRTSLLAWGRPGTVADPLPEGVAPLLQVLRDLVNGQTTSLEDGLLNDVNSRLDKDLPVVTNKLRTALTEWLRQLNALKTAPPASWPETSLTAKLSGVTAEAENLGQQLGAAETAEALWKALISAATLLGHVRQDLFGTVEGQAVATAKLASAMVLTLDAKLKPRADAIDLAASALPGEAVAGRLDAAAVFTERLNALRAAIIAGLDAAWNDDKTPLPGIGQGNFSVALAALEKKRPPREKAMGPGEETIPARTEADFAALLAGVPERVTPTAAPRWKIILEAVRAATVSEPVTVRARLIVPQGSDPPEVTLRWFRAGLPAGASAPGTYERSFIFPSPGPVVVRVEAVDSTGLGDSAELVLQVQAVHGAFAVASTQRTLEKVELIQNVATGAIITVAGWLIFSPSFTGTFPEFFAAFLWGFSADVGAAKVRELTESLKGLKVPIPAPKPPG